VGGCQSREPPYGTEIYIPTFTAAKTAGEQTEGSAVTEGTPTTTLEGAAVKNIAGMLIVSEQLHARGFTGGGSFDEVVGEQIHEQLDEQIDKYVIGQAIVNGKGVTGATEYKTVKFYEDTAKAREILTDKAGTCLRPTHFFSTSDFYSFVTHQVDATTERPIVVPTFAPGFPLTRNAESYDGEPERAWSRFTGTVLPGAVLWFTDDNVPNIGTTTKLRETARNRP
jgi:hypothetical protein